MSALTKLRTPRQGLLHLALALLLLFAQQWVLRHTLEHEADPAHHAAHGQCLSCLAAHAIDHASAGTPAVVVAIEVDTPTPLLQAPSTSPTVSLAAFQARAPPAFPS